VKLLRTIRLDASDGFVYERAAQAGEWAVPGAFEFWNCEPKTLSGRARQAFRGGFLGLTSLGWSTLVVAQPVLPVERAAAVEALAAHLLRAHGAPDLAAARAAAEEEIMAAMDLAEHPEGTLIALHRTVDADGNIREQFRTLRPSDAREAAQMPCSAGAFAIVEDEAAPLTAAGPSTIEEEIDLVGLAASRRVSRP
jgi:Family of unknown function (DUF6505)